MNFKTQLDPSLKRTDRETAKKAMSLFTENAKRTEQLMNSMPTNRELINKIYKYGFQKSSFQAKIACLMEKNE